ncbi:MAG: elongation factor G [Cetobacterium sp.]
MKNYEMNEIRNVTFLGHRGSGKTTLVESMLFSSETISKMGSVDNGSSTSDFDKEEVIRQFSINTSVVPLEYLGHKYNILDTPGYFDFSGEVSSALKVSGGAVLVLDATSGVDVGAEKSWRVLEENGTPRIIFINKMDKGIQNYEKLLRELKEKFGKKIAPFCIPIEEDEKFKGFINVVDLKTRIFDGKDCQDGKIPADRDISDIRNLLLEAVAETDEDLMEKFFSGKEFTESEIRKGLHHGTVTGELVPVLVGSAINGIGIKTLFEMLYDYMPTPQELYNGERVGVNPLTQEIEKRKVNENEPFSAIIFKTLVDPFIGKISMFKVNSGTIKRDTEILVANKNKRERISNVGYFRGIKQLPADEIKAGDIGATMKLQYAQTGDTICDKDNPIMYPTIEFPKPCLYFAVEPAEKTDDEKISTCLQRLIDEDPSFQVKRNFETKELLIGGQGEKHIGIILSKLENKFDVHAKINNLKVSYRETIKSSVSVQGKHKKQSGGAGQYGDVHIKFEPFEDEFKFVDEIRGGVVPRQYIPAVEKGLMEAKQKGVLAGYPVINIKATLFDGSYHAVDSNEISFKQAAMLAFRKGMQDARPILLEPIMRIEITVPDIYTGDVMGDLNKRRARILGMEPQNYGEQKLVAEVPESEILKYAIELRSMTQAKGNFNFDFIRYEEVPEHLSSKIINELNK